MAFSASTTNYHLPLPTDNDKSTWTDNNTAFQTIDDAIHANAVATVSFSNALAALTARVTALENAPGADLTGFVKVDNASGTGLTNTQYNKLTVQS